MDDDSPMMTVSRFIGLLREINANGPVSVGQMVQATGMPYPTTSRMIKTMLFHGLIEQEPNPRLYRVASMALTLSSGFQRHHRLAAAARPSIEALTHRIGWPVTVMTRVGTSMVARASTHHLTSLTFGPCPNGTTIPIEHSASGHVYLAHASRAERAGIVGGLQRFETYSPMMSLLVQGRPLENIRADGYATYERNAHTEHPGKTSSISVPIHHRDELQGTLTLVFFASAMPMKEALRRYLRELKLSVAVIEAALGASDQTKAPEKEPDPVNARNSTRARNLARAPSFAPVRRSVGPSDAAPAFSKLISTELRQVSAKPQFNFTHPL